MDDVIISWDIPYNKALNILTCLSLSLYKHIIIWWNVPWVYFIEGVLSSALAQRELVLNVYIALNFGWWFGRLGCLDVCDCKIINIHTVPSPFAKMSCGMLVLRTYWQESRLARSRVAVTQVPFFNFAIKWIWDFEKNISYVFLTTFTFDGCPRSGTAATPVKHERGIQ